MPILQIVTFKTSEEFKASQLVLKQALEIVFAVKGCDSIHYGHQEEDKGETGYLLILWATLEHHTTFRASPIYPIVLPLLRKAVANGAPASDITFVSFTGPHEGALFAPTTEISLVTLADRTTIDELRGALQRGMQSIRDVKFPAIVGNVVGKSGKAVFVIGWDDVVRHLGTRADPTSASGMVEIRSLISESKFTHTKLTHFAI